MRSRADRAYVVITDAEGRVLCCLNKRGNWTLPGGRRRRSETYLAAVKRESKEELGVKVKISGVVGVYERELAGRRPRVDIVYRGSAAGNPQARGEVVKLAWLTPEKARGRLGKRSQRHAVALAAAGAGLGAYKAR